MNVIIFSKDNAGQLDFLLGTLFKYAQFDITQVRIIFKPSTKEHAEQYNKVFEYWYREKGLLVETVYQTNLKANVLACIRSAYTMFLCDVDSFNAPTPDAFPLDAYECFSMSKEDEGANQKCEHNLHGNVYRSPDIYDCIQLLSAVETVEELQESLQQFNSLFTMYNDAGFINS